jgi:hypothetical protein
LVGQLTLPREQELIAETHAWLTDHRKEHAAYDMYLRNWGDWTNPWSNGAPA